jgi:glycosyltransferase involved in cell wall biosynthesis
VTRTSIVSALNENAVSTETVMTGYVDNAVIAERLRSMHVFALSSLQEGFPNTLLEAASVGIPIVATAVDGVKDVYRDLPDAVLVEPGDPSRLANAIQSVLRDDALAMRLSAQSLEVAARFSHEREQTAYVDLYEQFLSVATVRVDSLARMKLLTRNALSG